MFRACKLMTMAVACMTGAATASAAVILPVNSEKAWLGVMLGNAGEAGIEILDVIGDDSPAAVAGLQKGDVITGFNGAEVLDLSEFVGAVQRAKPGQQVTVDLQRDGKELSVKVTLGTRPANAERLSSAPFGFRFKNRGPGFLFHQGGGAWSQELHNILKDMGVDDGNVKVNVECEDGKGTVTVEHDGKTQTRDFDCSDMGDSSRVFQWHGGDFDADDFEINIPEIADLDLPEMKLDLRDKLMLHGDGLGKLMRLRSPSTKFSVNADGNITVTVRKGDSELNLTFDDAEELESSRPDLFKKYEDLMDEIDE